MCANSQSMTSGGPAGPTRTFDGWQSPCTSPSGTGGGWWALAHQLTYRSTGALPGYRSAIRSYCASTPSR